MYLMISLKELIRLDKLIKLIYNCNNIKWSNKPNGERSLYTLLKEQRNT